MISFVSCNSNIAGLFCCMNVYKHGMDVLIEVIFHVVILVSKLK